MDKLESMQVFASVVEGGSLSAASRQLEMPLATVSRKLAELEASLNVKLLLRSTRRMQLTDAGRAYLEACKQILESVAQAEQQASGAYTEARGQLVVTAPIVFGRIHMVPIACGFLRKHPNVDIQLRLSDRNFNLAEEHVDMALRIGTLPDSNLVASKVAAVHLVTCASPAYLRRRGEPRHPRDLHKHCCITFDGIMSATEWAYRVDGDSKRIAVHSRLSVSTAESAIQAAVEGFGLTRVISYQIHDLVKSGALKHILSPFEPESLPVSLVYPAQGRLPMKTRAFIDHAKHELKQRLKRL